MFPEPSFDTAVIPKSVPLSSFSLQGECPHQCHHVETVSGLCKVLNEAKKMFGMAMVDPDTKQAKDHSDDVGD